MLESIKINGIRSCQNILLDEIGAMTALVGRNGVGKTNILLAILAFAKRASSGDLIDIYRFSDLYSFSARLQIDGNILEYSLAMLEDNLAEGEPKLENRFIVESLFLINGSIKESIFEREKEKISLSVSRIALNTNVRTSAMTAIEAFSPDDPSMQYVRPLLHFLRGIRYYEFAEVFSKQEFAIRESEYQVWKANRRGITTQSSSADHSASVDSSISMRILDMHMSKDGSFDELTQLVGSDGLGLLSGINVSEHEFHIDGDDKSARTRKIYLLSFIPIAYKDSSRGIGLSDLSFGTRRLLAMMVFLLSDHSSLFLFEQPEDGIHPGLLSKVIPTLKSYSNRGQFIFSTHSADVLNRMQSADVRLVEIADECTTLRKLSSAELQAAKSYLQEDGTLADFIDSVQED
jgi:AAA15 family ATPase/GTPase